MAKGKKVKRKDKKGTNDNDKKEKTEEIDANVKEHEERHGTTVIAFFKKDELQEIRNKLNVKVLTDNDMLLGAVALGKFDVVKRLLKQGSPINYAGTDNMTSLMWAVKCKRVEMMDLLIRRGADITAVDSDGNNALLLAIQSSDWDQDTFLDFWHLVLENGFKTLLDQANKTGNTALHYAVKRQWDNVLEEFIEVGADVNCVTAKGVTPLMMAGSRDDSAIVSKLLYAKADISREDQRGCTALCYAISYMIQKRLESPNPSLQQFIEKINDPSSPLTLEVYLKRRLDLLVYPPEENFSSTINSLLTHIVTFFVRYIQAGLELLLELQVFVRVREATERHIEDIEYVLALLAITLELVRSCKCCIGEAVQQSVVKNFIDADIPETCLNVLRKHGLAPLSNNIMNAALIPIMAVCTTDCKLGKIWLQKNFSQLQPFYQKYYRTCIINFNILADDYHVRLLKINLKEFQSLMQRIESGEIIAEDILPPTKKKKFIGNNEMNTQLPLKKETLKVINSASYCETNKNNNVLVSDFDKKDKETKVYRSNDCSSISNKSSEEVIHLSDKNNSLVRPQKISSIILQDEYQKVYNKKENLLNKFKNFSNGSEASNSLKIIETYNAVKTKSEIYQPTKMLEKPLDDIKITKIMQPNHLKLGETFSSVLQQNLNKEKRVSAILKHPGNDLQHINNTGTGDCIMNKNLPCNIDKYNDNFINVLSDNEDDYIKENQSDTTGHEMVSNLSRKNNKLKSVFVANTNRTITLTNNNCKNNDEDDDTIIESEHDENLSQKSDATKIVSEGSVILEDDDSELLQSNQNCNQNLNNEHSKEILFYEKLLNDVIDEYGAGGDINKDITEENMTILSNSSSSIYLTCDECKKMIVCIDKLIKKIVNHYEMLWKNDWESGYINATCGPHTLLELMTKLPYYERIHLQRLIDIWDFLKNILISKTIDNCQIKKDVFKKLYNYLKNYSNKLETEVSNTINSQEPGWYNIDMSMHKDILDFLEKDDCVESESNGKLNKTNDLNENESNTDNESNIKQFTERDAVEVKQEEEEKSKEIMDTKHNEAIDVDDGYDEGSEECCEDQDVGSTKNEMLNENKQVDEMNQQQLYQKNNESETKVQKKITLEEQLDQYFKKETNNDSYNNENWDEGDVMKTDFKEEKYHESKWIWNNGQDAYMIQNSKSMEIIKPKEQNVNDKFMISESNNSLKTLIKHETVTMKTATMHSVSYRAILKHYSEDNNGESNVSTGATANEKSNGCYRAILKRNDSLKTNCSLPSLSGVTPSPSLSSLSLPSPPPGFPPQPIKQQPIKEEVTKWKFPISNKDRKLMYSSIRHLDQISKLRSMTPLRCQSFDSGALTVASPDTYPDFKLFDGGNFGAVELGLDSEGYPLAVKRFTCFQTKGTIMTGSLLKSLVLNMLDLHHWNIVPYSICVDAEEQILIATPLCERNLVEHIKFLKESDTLNSNSLDLVKQVFEGLHFLHLLEKPITHGNMKPTNVLVDAEGNLRLADFGLHKVLYKQMCPLGSTAIWWAQETYYVYQATWQMVCTLKSDIQVAGMLMHYILTGGLHPFGGDSPSILENLLAGVPALHTTISCDVNDLLSWMLVHSPLDRPNITTVLRHICFWPKNRKWDFILACSGLNDDRTKSILPLNEFFVFINRRAHEEKSSGDWVSIINENFPTLLSQATFDKENPSGLLQFINYCVTTTNLKDQLKEFFLQAFPNLALCLYRLIEDSLWQTHPALVRFTLWTSSQLR